MEIHSEEYQEAHLEYPDEKNRHVIQVIAADRSSASEKALMIRPTAGPLQVLTAR
jgi:hypothetical protein